jgi:hypothetical protein
MSSIGPFGHSSEIWKELGYDAKEMILNDRIDEGNQSAEEGDLM